MVSNSTHCDVPQNSFGLHTEGAVPTVGKPSRSIVGGGGIDPQLLSTRDAAQGEGGNLESISRRSDSQIELDGVTVPGKAKVDRKVGRRGQTAADPLWFRPDRRKESTSLTGCVGNCF